MGFAPGEIELNSLIKENEVGINEGCRAGEMKVENVKCKV